MPRNTKYEQDEVKEEVKEEVLEEQPEEEKVQIVTENQYIIHELLKSNTTIELLDRKMTYLISLLEASTRKY